MSIMLIVMFFRVAVVFSTVVPDDGDILLFPSWLNHSVRKNRSQEQRVSVAFNIDIISNNDIAYGLAKQSNAPSHRTERSIKGLIK